MGAADAPEEREADAVADRVVSGAPLATLIVDDAVTPTPAQLNRTAFLATLRRQVTEAANQALGPEQSAEQCPYIEQWFVRHAASDAPTLERMARRYSGVDSARDAQGYIPPILERLRTGIARWRAGEDLATELSAAGLGDAAGAVQAGAIATGRGR